MQINKTLTKWITGAALAGAMLFAAPKKADAQVSFGISVGRPAYGYGYGYRPYYGYGYGYPPYAAYGYGYRPYPAYGYGYGYGYRPYYHGYARPYGYGRRWYSHEQRWQDNAGANCTGICIFARRSDIDNTARPLHEIVISTGAKASSFRPEQDSFTVLRSGETCISINLPQDWCAPFFARSLREGWGT